MIETPLTVIQDPNNGQVSILDKRGFSIAECHWDDEAHEIMDAVNSGAALRAENERLRGALKPFAELGHGYRTFNPAHYVQLDLNVGDLHRARAALGESNG